MLKNRWRYTNDIHDYIYIGKEKFKLNTAYNNVFKILKYMRQNEDVVNAFLTYIFYKPDLESIYQLTKKWETSQFVDLVNTIAKDILFFEEETENKDTKYYDIEEDSDLIFASFYFDYGISLEEKKGKLTWKEFVILLENLSENTPLQKMISLCKTPLDQLSDEGKVMRAQRMSMLNKDYNLNSQISGLMSVLKQTAKKK